MRNYIQLIDTSDPTGPKALRRDEIQSEFPTFWAIGNLDILDTNLLGLFCSIKCTGKIIVKTYDFMRLLRDVRVVVAPCVRVVVTSSA